MLEEHEELNTLTSPIKEGLASIKLAYEEIIHTLQKVRLAHNQTKESLELAIAQRREIIAKAKDLRRCAEPLKQEVLKAQAQQAELEKLRAELESLRQKQKVIEEYFVTAEQNLRANEEGARPEGCALPEGDEWDGYEVVNVEEKVFFFAWISKYTLTERFESQP